MPIDRFNTDPSYWEEILIKEGCLGLEDEKKSFGDISLSEDPEDQEIADKLATENKDIKYYGSPTTFKSLIKEIRYSLENLTNSSTELGIAVHVSCMNPADSITVFQKGGLQHRFNTCETIGYTRQKLKKTIQKTLGLGLIEK